MFGGGSGRLQTGELDSDDGDSCDPTATSDVAREFFFFPRKRHVRTVVVRSPPAFFFTESSTKSGGGMGFFLDPSSPEEFFCVGYTHAVIKTSLCKRVEIQKCDVGERSTEHVIEVGFCFASADTLKASGGRVVGSREQF